MRRASAAPRSATSLHSALYTFYVTRWPRRSPAAWYNTAMPRQTRAPSRLVLLVALALLAACDPSGGQPAPPSGTGAVQPPAPVPSPTPAPPPPALLQQALDARAAGDDDASAVALHALVTAWPDAPEARPARYYLAESYARRARWASAADAFVAFLADGAADALAARATFWLARAHEALGEQEQAVAAYRRYRSLRAPLDLYASMREAGLLGALGRAEEAAASYEAVAVSGLPAGERAAAYEGAIAQRRKLGQSDAALKLYGALLSLAKTPEYRARVLAGAADLAAAAGQPDQARAWLREAASDAPETPQALDAVARLLADPQGGLDPMIAARVFVAHGRPADALPHFDAAIAAASGDTALDLRRQRALARRAAADFDGALADLAALAAEAPNSDPGRQAQLDWVQTRGQKGETQAAIDGYRQFAASYPDDPRAPEALARRAILLDRLGDAAGAATQRLDLAGRYPASEQAAPALDAAGRWLYTNGKPAEARAAWEALSRQAKGVWAARGAYWAARAAQQAGQSDAGELFRQAARLAPESYYAARAAEHLGEQPPPGVGLDATTTAAEWQAADAWVAGWAGTPPAAPAAPADDPALQRAVELAAVGLAAEAAAEWEAAINARRDQPAQLLHLARFAADQGATAAALRAASALVAAAPEGSAVPPVIQRLRFPAPYPAVALRAAREFNLDPRLLYALLRQESAFDPGAVSSAGALGLAQVMPETGRGIARQLQIADFEPGDLLQPGVALRFGAFYLRQQLDAHGGSVQAALAAYNGGPGNAARWAAAAPPTDPDAFVEAIDFGETSAYVKQVYGNYGVYRRLYAVP